MNDNILKERAKDIETKLLNYLFGTNSTVTNSNVPNEAEGLTKEKLYDALNRLRAEDSETKKRVIQLFYSMGFKVVSDNTIPAPFVCLPGEFKEALAEAQKEIAE